MCSSPRSVDEQVIKNRKLNVPFAKNVGIQCRHCDVHNVRETPTNLTVLQFPHLVGLLCVEEVRLIYLLN